MPSPPLSFFERGDRHVVRPLHFVVLLWFLAKQLVRSNVLLAREVISRRGRLRTAVIASPLHTRSPALINAFCNLLAINPGTLVIEINEPGRVVYVHVFFLHDVETVARDVDELQLLVIDAFTPPSRAPIARTNVRT